MFSVLLKERLQWAFVIFGVAAALGCGPQTATWDTSSGVTIQQSGDDGIGEQIRAASAVVPPTAMQGPGLAGASGGVHVKLFRGGSYDIRLPMPQLAACQVPVWYGIRTTSKQAQVEYRLLDRGDGTVFVNAKLSGTKDQEFSIEWSSVVLVAGKVLAPKQIPPEPFVRSTPCVQSDDRRIKTLADKLWPGAGKTNEYARNIQGFIRDMKQKKQSRSLDALGVLESGQGGICTANANLACALLRAKQIPCRSISVIPPISRRLEMHRIVEYYEDGVWSPFDPSMVHADVPAKPWQNIIMASTTIPDEEAAMKPRMGAMLGCPFGQELEISRVGLGLSGNDFFWTLAVPLAEFDVSDEAFRLTEEAWKGYLKSGEPSTAYVDAASARNLEQYVEAMKKK